MTPTLLSWQATIPDGIEKRHVTPDLQRPEIYIREAEVTLSARVCPLFCTPHAFTSQNDYDRLREIATSHYPEVGCQSSGIACKTDAVQYWKNKDKYCERSSFMSIALASSPASQLRKISFTILISKSHSNSKIIRSRSPW